MLALLLFALASAQQAWTEIPASQKPNIMQIKRQGRVACMGLRLDEGRAVTSAECTGDDPAALRLLQHREMPGSLDIVKSAKLPVADIVKQGSWTAASPKDNNVAFLLIETEGATVNDYDPITPDLLAAESTVFAAHRYKLQNGQNRDVVVIYQRSYTRVGNAECQPQGSRNLTRFEFCLKPTVRDRTGLSSLERGSPVLVRQDSREVVAGIVNDVVGDGDEQPIVVTNVLFYMLALAFSK